MIRNWRASVAAEAVRVSRQSGDDARTDSSTAAFADQAGAQTQVGRVLRLPTREV